MVQWIFKWIQHHKTEINTGNDKKSIKNRKMSVFVVKGWNFIRFYRFFQQISRPRRILPQMANFYAFYIRIQRFLSVFSLQSGKASVCRQLRVQSGLNVPFACRLVQQESEREEIHELCEKLIMNSSFLKFFREIDRFLQMSDNFKWKFGNLSEFWAKLNVIFSIASVFTRGTLKVLILHRHGF